MTQRLPTTLYIGQIKINIEIIQPLISLQANIVNTFCYVVSDDQNPHIQKPSITNVIRNEGERLFILNNARYEYVLELIFIYTSVKAITQFVHN